MSRTLFWYIFRDLVRIFFLASGVLSAIMSFGGLLRPLYEIGLDLSQVGKILGWSGPAMTAYSLPIAALFATTIVYGRLSSDNEVTACRAAGLSHLAMSSPAFVLGILTAVASVGLLCFIVPYSMLKVEKIIYSNLAELAVGQIERTHLVHFDQGDQARTIFARSARVLPPDPANPLDQALQIDGAVYVTYEKQPKNQPKTQIPEDYFTASQAVINIHQANDGDDVSFMMDLKGGMKFSRPGAAVPRQNAQFSIQEQIVGPVPMNSPVEEKTQFMNIFRLRELLDHPESARKVAKELHDISRSDQVHDYLQSLAEQLNGPNHRVKLENASESYDLLPASAAAEIRGDRLTLVGKAGDPVRLVQTRGKQGLMTAEAQEIGIKAFPDTANKQIGLQIEMLGPVITVNGSTTPRENFSRPLTVPMPPAIAALNDRPVRSYLNNSGDSEVWRNLLHALRKINNGVISELHSRMSFATSCFILVMVGCALGMMFRSGNFLSAFAVSVIPALLTIALIVAGQQTATNVPWTTELVYHDPLPLGILLVWIGNGVNFLVAFVLLWRLNRQ
ncbi:MAG TPA: LptF/LptG family permease [Tepidisphaeraceae bacterium]|nr:LptF/LptG family permease [Tepidisphaeraceae bacterium]